MLWEFTVSELLLILAVASLAVIAFATGGSERVAAAGRETLSFFSTVWFRLLLGFALAGLVTVLIPAEAIGKHLGEESGVGGLLIAMLAGSLTPGGPFIQFPIIATLQRSGAGSGPLAAYLTAWLLIPLQRVIIWELPFLGYQFVTARLLMSLAVPLAIGAAVPVVLRKLQAWLGEARG
jgi:uncharacterized protein